MYGYVRFCFQFVFKDVAVMSSNKIAQPNKKRTVHMHAKHALIHSQAVFPGHTQTRQILHY